MDSPNYATSETWPAPNPALAAALIGSALAAQGFTPAHGTRPWKLAEFDRCADWIAAAIGNNVGIVLNRSATADVTGLLDVWGRPWLEDNVESHLKTDELGAGASLTLIARGPHVHNTGGVEPSESNTDQAVGTTLTVKGETSST